MIAPQMCWDRVTIHKYNNFSNSVAPVSLKIQAQKCKKKNLA